MHSDFSLNNVFYSKIREAKDGNGAAGDIWGTTVRNKRVPISSFIGIFATEDCETRSQRHFGNLCSSGIISYGGLSRGGCEAYLVTLTDRRSFLCFSGQRGTIAKSLCMRSICVS